ncbi:hypothetical protein DA83_04215 [Pseudomonas sp. 250J]|uniref:TRAP transporter substrate-binding protein DctP n=1 Tax=Pseudomonas peradeniyensis TaxID=2745488 RepID=A0ABT2VDJ2_9PSED|nr:MULTISPECIES: TRAP transporter substrate-binding protein DctP [Pseudomonas]KNX77010.1 hypothetical protein DA83_04215 [Pseudomonas sp. 250J]MCU7239794.1 TRAP transporter substrate-binding protein DctP [Pseudomonas peradeniyensis]MCU7282943.1 TRAP transporter substrate-binding protein DctP [Pseudomonas peradeniyensis]QZA56272.1 TRAP transporter substrate-binding protein DctP [Pseudomonas sp. 2hn]
MKAGLIATAIFFGQLSLASATTPSQSVFVQVALPPDTGFDVGALKTRLPTQASVEVRLASEASEVVDQVRQGKIDIALVPTSGISRYAPNFAVFDLPFIVSEGAADKLFSGVFGHETTPYLLSSLKSSGLGQIGGALYVDTYVLASQTPARSPGDYRGSRVALLQDSPMRGPLEATGASLVLMQNNKEIVRALEHGTIDAAELPLRELGHSFETPYIAMTSHRFSALAVIYNKSKYAQLSTEVREHIDSAFRTTRDSMYRPRPSFPENELEVDNNIRNEWRHLVEKTQWKTIDKVDKGLLTALQEPMVFHPMSATGEPGSDLRWNTWYQSGSETFSQQLYPDREYDLTLDLGRASYPGTLATAAEQWIFREIQRTPEGADISLLIRPVITSDILTVRADQPLTAKVLKIKRDRLVPQANDLQLVEQAASRQITLQTLSKALSVSEPLTWPIVVANRTGCAQIAFSIWNFSGLRPLDQIVINVPVVAHAGSPTPDCKASIDGGIDSLLSLDAQDPLSQADAALQFFDTGSKREGDAKTVAVFVSRTELQSALDKGAPPPVHAWTLKDELSRFLQQPENLQRSITKAHDEIDKQRPYDSVVRQLSASIFNARERSEDAVTEHAKKTLKELAAQSTPAMVLTRYFDNDGSIQYLPLALLAADAQERILSKRLTVVQPVAEPNSLPKNSCVDNWDLAIPDRLEGAQAEAAELLAKSDWRPTGAGNHWYRDNPQLFNFLRSRGNDNPPRTGLLLLAHHDKGGITYAWDEKPDRVINAEVRRTFGAGSFAVLAACTTSGASRESRNFMNHLLDNGMEAVITSPFQVDTTFGTHFAISFANAIKKAQDKGEPARLIELFNRAVDDTMQAYHEHPGYSDMALELQIIGNHDVKLCSSTEANH